MMSTGLRRFLTFLSACLAGVLMAAAARAVPPEGDLKLVVILTRHGVRPPLTANKAMEPYSSAPWPKWDVPPSFLTPHGHREMVLMGDYYRALYVRAGLLRGRTAEDVGGITFLADSDERTVETAHALAEGLVPGGKPPVRALATGTPDPLYRHVKGTAAEPDLALGTAAVLGRIGGDPRSFYGACAPAFETLQRVLFAGSDETPPGKTSVLSLPTVFRPGDHGETIDFAGPLHQGETLVDDLLLEYTEGMPLSDVGWGRVDRRTLTQLLRLHALYFDLTQRTFYPAQAQASNLASHLLATLQQGASGRPQAGAIGAPGQRMVVIVGHDTNQANLGGLLGLEWWLPDMEPNPVLPGGALVFELRQRGEGGPCSVRVRYVAASLDQIRTLQPLSLEAPPQTAPIFIPGCSGSAPGYDAPLEAFAARVRRAVDPRFVVPGNL